MNKKIFIPIGALVGATVVFTLNYPSTPPAMPTDFSPSMRVTVLNNPNPLRALVSFKHTAKNGDLFDISITNITKPAEIRLFRNGVDDTDIILNELAYSDMHFGPQGRRVDIGHELIPKALAADVDGLGIAVRAVSGEMVEKIRERALKDKTSFRLAADALRKELTDSI
jgi:hypothetical protein